MENPRDFFQWVSVAIDFFEKSIGRDIIVEFQGYKIEPFLVVGELIRNKDIFQSETV